MSLDKPLWLKDVYPNFEIGEGTYGGLRVFDWKQGTKLKIGSYSSFAFDVKALLGGEHHTEWVSTYPFSKLWPEAEDVVGHPVSRGDISIGSDVWVGAEAMILSGVTIGHGAVIGSRALVTKDIPPYAIAGGVSAKVLGFRFSPGTIAELLETAWWDWPREKIVRAIPFILSGEISTFINGSRSGRFDR